MTLDKTYDPKKIEKDLYSRWESAGYFKPDMSSDAEAYTIMLPPPNVTGSLHMGHAFQDTIMDTLIRYQRMSGKKTLWQGGTDHAGIATQMVVERKTLAEEGKTKEDYGRDAFIEKIWEWKGESGNMISKQLRRMGASMDWSRERFTMDEGFSNAVQKTFIQLYKDGLIYRGKRLVNWDPKLHTAISDIEVENHDTNGSMWYIRYPLCDGEKTLDGLDYIMVATTRPETLLGDTAVAVNPEDDRFKHLVGKFVEVPFVKRRIPIVTDSHADMEKGCGCVKITPAHDFNDYEVGKRHELPMINIFTLDAKIRSSAEVVDTNGEASTSFDDALPEAYQGLDRFDARKQIVDDLKDLGLLDHIEDHQLTLPYGDRGGVVIEPMLTNQWYVRSKPLAEMAIEAVEDGRIKFVPAQYENMYFSWMRNIQDWCISRQIWWGHRIPVWYDEAGDFYVGNSEEEVRQENNIASDVALRQDEDVLDTWFSSGLWTFGTLGWPEKTVDFETFHPSSVLVTGFDIIPFWVARMIMMTMHLIRDEKGDPVVPFSTVYVTGLIRDENGDKMSKSKGNVIDPLDLIDGIELEDLVQKRCSNMMQPQLAQKIEKYTRKQYPDGIPAYGTDALRFTLAALASTARNVNWDMARLEGYRNFCTKLWNASRYVMMYTEDRDCGFDTLAKNGSLEYSPADLWIYQELQATIKTFRQHLDSFRLDLAAQTLYNFVWNEFCDWYLELTKPILFDGEESQQVAARHMLVTTLETILRMAHPIIPFITDTIWQTIKPFFPSMEADSVMACSFPVADENAADPVVAANIGWTKDFIVSLRNMRKEHDIKPSKPLDIVVKTDDADIQAYIRENQGTLNRLAKTSGITICEAGAEPKDSISLLVGKSEILISTEGLIDKEKELERLEKKIAETTQAIKQLSGRLNNKGFLEKAPAHVVEKDKAQLAELEEALETLTAGKAALV